jgi:hypothetical protein
VPELERQHVPELMAWHTFRWENMKAKEVGVEAWCRGMGVMFLIRGRGAQDEQSRQRTILLRWRQK